MITIIPSLILLYRPINVWLPFNLNNRSWGLFRPQRNIKRHYFLIGWTYSFVTTFGVWTPLLHSFYIKLVTFSGFARTPHIQKRKFFSIFVWGLSIFIFSCFQCKCPTNKRRNVGAFFINICPWLNCITNDIMTSPHPCVLVEQVKFIW